MQCFVKFDCAKSCSQLWECECYAKARNAIATHVDSDDKKDAPIQGTLSPFIGSSTILVVEPCQHHVSVCALGGIRMKAKKDGFPN